jgi:hypothetical protein
MVVIILLIFLEEKKMLTLRRLAFALVHFVFCESHLAAEK